MAGHVLQLVLDLLFGHVDVFRRRDAVDDEFGLYIICGAFLLALPEGNPVHIHGAGIHSLGGKRPNHAFQAHIHLMLDERFRYRELVQLYKFGKDFFPLQLFCR
jgi:hypothetical protein